MTGTPPATDLFAGVPVADFDRALTWYRTFLGGEPSFHPHDTEAVWAVGAHSYVYIERRPDRAGHAMLMIMAADLDATVAGLTRRGLEPDRVEEYGGGMRKVVYADPDGNEISYGGVSASGVPGSGVRPSTS
ncbi:VOC family protein [Micromonospora cathayae]|uniref:VOC family protein n=1 Tax=Micromonospora cathayae TaxID=3028804 RepID=A0ABY7ZPL4_9ACTN|nr:VOC family protein [Micromonospora sp. HUAS 3]WDZ83814.1 VOC family protein [Micromonospora sp. HUAS 3]